MKGWRTHASSFYKGGREDSDTDFLFSCWRNFFQQSSRFSLMPLFKELWKKYTVARHSLSSHLWASYKPQSRINGFVKKSTWLILGYKKSVTLPSEFFLSEGKTVLGPSWWKDWIIRPSPPTSPPQRTSPHDGNCKQTCSSSSGFRYCAADWRKKICELVQMHLVELLMAESRLFQFSPICCSCIIDKSTVVSMQWPVSRAQISAFLFNILLFTIISMLKTRGQKTTKNISTYEKVTSKVNHVLACRASLP